jgi:hypothetical protein
MRRLRPRTKRSFYFALVALFLINASLTSILGNASFFCLADGGSHEGDDDFLAEILAEQAREEAELDGMEAEVREYEAMKARQSSGGGMPGGGGPNVNKMGGGTANFSKIEDDLRKKEAEKAKKKVAEDEANASQEAERIRLMRESAFEAELKKMNDEQRKRAQRQKARDAKVVKRVLRAHRAGRHYAVLGIRNLELQLGPFYFLNFSIGPWTIFHVKTREIKRVYRNLARAVHPDKNRDGRAEEAFHALEESAEILTDEKKRSDYDKRIIATRRRRNKYAMESALGASRLAWSKSVSTLRLVKRILGPFSTPILVVTALII